MLDESDDVMGVIDARVQARYQMPVAELRRKVAADPHEDAEATNVVHWYGMLVRAQAVVERAEDALVEALGTRPGVLDDPVMALAHQVNAAVGARDDRALVVNNLLDPNRSGKRSPGPRPGAAPSAHRPPALPTASPAFPRLPSVPARGTTR